ncbi:MAG: PspA/IM30 family protein [Candidatus Eremiobacteraeota bacterium]|nr:PspA/IM30 family protein [Candidatus Eremiobacteraeota bacterium]MCW5868443.1 PspA/IM30 family protein [Candidatus Eremiobacteraeota bacterium]
MFSRLGKLIKGFFSLFISNLETANPKALLEAEIVSFQEAVGTYNKSLAQQAALVQKMQNQIGKQKSEFDKLKGRITVLVKAGKNEEAGRLALQAKNLSQSLAELEAQFTQTDTMYKNMVKQRDVYIRDAQRRIETIKQKLSQAEIAESQAKLAEIATATSFSMAGSGATLERLEEKLDDRVAQAQGKARVAADSIAGGEWNVKAEEEAALEQAALFELMGDLGVSAPASTQTASPTATRPLQI